MQKLLDLYVSLFHFWMRFPEKIRFLLVGGYNTVISYGLYALFVWMSDGDYIQRALLLSFLISSLNSYFTQKIYVFNTRGNYAREYIKCLCSWAIGYILNAAMLFVMVDCWQWNAYWAQVGAVVIITVNSYLLLKYFAFKPCGC